MTGDEEDTGVISEAFFYTFFSYNTIEWKIAHFRTIKEYQLLRQKVVYICCEL